MSYAVGSLLVGIGSVVENIAGKIVFPCRHNVEQERCLHVDEHGQVVAADGDFTAFQAIELGCHLIGRHEIAVADLLQNWFVLVLGEEGRLVPELQVHGMLDRR